MKDLTPDAKIAPESEKRSVRTRASIWTRDRKRKGAKAANIMTLNAQFHFTQADSGTSAQEQVRVIHAANNNNRSIERLRPGGWRRSDASHVRNAAAPSICATGNWAMIAG